MNSSFVNILLKTKTASRAMIISKILNILVFLISCPVTSIAILRTAYLIPHILTKYIECNTKAVGTFFAKSKAI